MIEYLPKLMEILKNNFILFLINFVTKVFKKFNIKVLFKIELKRISIGEINGEVDIKLINIVKSQMKL